MSRPIRHMFWDFDGTLYDSYPQITQAFLAALKDVGLNGALDAAEATRLLKGSVFHAATVCAERYDVDVQRIIQAFRPYHQAAAVFPAYDGLAECLTCLHKAGVRHYLYTHRDMRAVEQLTCDGLWPLFTDKVTRVDGFADKPAPDALLALMARNGVDAQEAAMVGDRDIDINAGHNAGMRGILFAPYGYYSDLYAEFRASSMAGICEQVLGLLS